MEKLDVNKADNALFWKFIVNERNRLAKEYTFYFPMVADVPFPIYEDPSDPESELGDIYFEELLIVKNQEDLGFGQFENIEISELVWLAIDFWEETLQFLEKRIAAEISNE